MYGLGVICDEMLGLVLMVGIQTTLSVNMRRTVLLERERKVHAVQTNSTNHPEIDKQASTYRAKTSHRAPRSGQLYGLRAERSGV